jgi:steroid delta-isomerase-like uncharacterized protein
MSAETSKRIYNQYVEAVWNYHNVAAMDEFFAEEFVDHSAPPGQEPGLTGLKSTFAHIFNAFPDCQVEVYDLLVDGDKLIARLTFSGTHRNIFFGILPTGKSVTRSSIHILRFANGKMAEHWGNTDDLGMMMQLGVISMPGQ